MQPSSPTSNGCGVNVGDNAVSVALVVAVAVEVAVNVAVDVAVDVNVTLVAVAVAVVVAVGDSVVGMADRHALTASSQTHANILRFIFIMLCSLSLIRGIYS
jgi:hypothetical protein